MTYKAKLIVLEGIDGTGKTTTANKLKEHYEKQGKKVKLYHEPYQYGSIDIKKILEGKNTDLSVLLLMMAVRDNSIEYILKPALTEYDIVISDRYYYSTYAYQYKAFNNYDLEQFFNLNNLEYPKPDKLIFFEIENFKTYSNNKGDVFEKQDTQTFYNIQDRYLEVLDNCKNYGLYYSNIKRIEVNQNKQPYFDFNQVLEALEGI